MFSYDKLKDQEIINKEEVNKYVCFKLNEQEYGIDVADVTEVITTQEITPVVHTPEFIMGVINLRGEIIAIIDIKSFFMLPKERTKPQENIIIVKYGEKIGGLMVDSVTEIKECVKQEYESLPLTVSGKIAEYLKGVINYGNHPVMIVNIGNIINSEEFKMFE